jgi:hypothetical protein
MYIFFSIMNLFGVLKYKKMGEDFVCNSGIPFTIIRFVYRKSVSVGTRGYIILTWYKLFAGLED